MVYRPEQNGRAERKHRHLLDTARALRIQAGLPQKFWGDCVLTATYLINKMPSVLLHWKTPYEVLFSKEPSYDNIRVFGCLCYALMAPKSSDKMEARGRRCVFIGYPPNQKGYKLYDLTTHTTFSSKDVVFHEHVFPFLSAESESGAERNQTVDNFMPLCPMIHDEEEENETDFDVPMPKTNDLQLLLKYILLHIHLLYLLQGG